MNRRAALCGSGAIFISVLAGCSSDETDADSDGNGDDDEPETVVDETISDPSNYSVDAGDVINVDVTGYEGAAIVRVVNVGGAAESIYRETVESDASFDIAVEDAGTYEIRAVPQGETKLRARIIRS